MQPVFVGSASVAERLARKDPNETADRVEFGLILEGGALKTQAVMVHPVVGIDPRDVAASAMGRALDQAGYESFMRLRKDSNPGVTMGPVPGDVEAAIRRPVIDQYAFEIGFGLAFDAAQAGLEGRFGVPDGEQDRNSRAGSGHERA